MKKTQLLLFLIPFVLSCSKSDDSQPANKDLVFENTIPVNIPEFVFNNIVPGISEINVTANGTIADYKKVTLEMNIEHGYQRDLVFELVAPDGASRTFVYRAGISHKYVAANNLRFNALFTNYLAEDADFAAGNYRESKGAISSSEPALEPIFTFLQNKNVNGIWKLKARDLSDAYTGSIKSWRLVFGEGAITP